jgi:hypothetical protein
MIQVVNRLFQTKPIVAHSPGPPGIGFQRFCEAVLGQPPRPTRGCADLTILTWNAGPRPAKPTGILERSLERLGVVPRVLGEGTANWHNILKFPLTAKALASIRTPYVMGADSSDVVVFDDPATLLETFERHFTCDLVYNATGSRCWPELPTFVDYESSLPMAAVAQGRHWLNAGVWIGRTPFCRQFFTRLAEEPPVEGFPWSEQAVVKRAWPQWHPQVQLDYLCQMFQWFNEDREVLSIQRPLAPRQRQLLKILRPLGEHLVGAEVGVLEGGTSDALLQNLPELQLWMVDPWRPGEESLPEHMRDAASLEEAYQRARWWTEYAQQRRFILREASPGAANRFDDAQLDFVFLDANHRYERVRDDIYAWWPKIRPQGLLTGHGYLAPLNAAESWGVRRAVDEFATAVHRTVHVGDDGVFGIGK